MIKAIKMRKTRSKTAENAKKVVLAGNPNAGKTTLFNSLTRSNLRTGNFHGVTTAPAKKLVRLNGESVEFIDVPGAYSFKKYSLEEGSAIEEIKSADLVINVIDALTLENSLNLTEQILSFGARTAVYVTKLPLLKKRGGSLNLEKLSKALGVPVFATPKALKSFVAEEIKDAQKAVNPPEKIELAGVYSGGRVAPSRADKLFANPYFGLAVFIVSIVAMFFFAFYPKMPGALLKGLTEDGIDLLGDVITSKMSSPAVISLLKEGILGGVGGVLSFVPQIAVLYFFLVILDESGITSSLSFTTDGLFERVRLSGRCAFSLISGFGCTATAILTTRGYTTPSAQKRTVAILPFIPCGAKLPVFLTFLSPLFKNPFPAVTCFYFAGTAVSLIVSALIKGEREELFSEIAPIVLPSPKTVLFKLYFYIKGFIIKALGIIMLFCVLSWWLSHFSFTMSYCDVNDSMLAHISKLLTPVFYPMGVTDWRVAYSAICGFTAKENVAMSISMLIPEGLNLGLSPSLAVCTFMLLSPACMSAFAVSCKEVGLRFTLKCAVFQLILAFLGAYLVRLATIWI